MPQENQNLHDTAALRALASGELLKPMEPPAVSAPRPVSPGVPIIPNDNNDNTISHADALRSITMPGNPIARNGATNGSANSRNGTARSAARLNAHAGIHFRKTIIPLLLVMAIVLIGLGVFTLVKVNNSSPEAIAKNPILDNGTLFAGVTITLGVFLIAGSLFFHYEVKKHHRQNGGGKK